MSRVVFSDTHEGLLERVERIEKDNRTIDLVFSEKLDDKFAEIDQKLLNLANIVTDILQERNHFEPQACTVRVDVHCPKCNATLVQILGYTSLSFSCKCRCCNHAWDTPVGSIF